MNQIVLIETIDSAQASLMFEQNQKTLSSYLSGIFMQSSIENGNGRMYPLSEISAAVESVNKRIAEGHTIYGELNHPDNLNIDLNNVSHIITEMKIDGQNAIGKAKLLNTPKGQVVKAILEGGGKLGVSSRGSGNVIEGKVNGFNLVTVDIVAQPSAPDAYPAHVMEELNGDKKVMTLAEAMVQDPKAQKYFKVAIAELFEKLTGQKLK